MNQIPTIGQRNPASVVRDVMEALPTLRTLVVVGIHEDGSADIWASETPDELDRAAIILQSHACASWQD